GEAIATVGETRHTVTAGSALVVPAHVSFSLTNVSTKPFRAAVVLPVGGQAVIEGQIPFTPPWAV
ncbi:MAG: cupin domain-containing protein, partial [Pseudomonadota bacterium]